MEEEGPPASSSCADWFFPRIQLNSHAKQATFQVQRSWKVLKLKETLAECEIGDKVKGKEPKIKLIYNGKLLENDRTLEYYKITSQLTITVIATVNGGAQAPNSSVRRMDRKQKLLKGRGSRDPDCINGEDIEPRARLPCGCVFCAETVYNSIVHQFSTKWDMTELTCPNCDALTPWPLLACVGALSKDEFKKYTNLLRRKRKDVQRQHSLNCPFCSANVSRPQSLGQNRVRCRICSKQDFCFECQKPWKKGGLQLCGNPECGTTSCQKLLDTCEMIVTSDKKEPCPKFRACPHCLQIVEYRKACSHIICPNRACQKQFCIFCLRNYPCSKEVGACVCAPRQQLS